MTKAPQSRKKLNYPLNPTMAHRNCLQGSFSSDFSNQDLHLNTLSKSPQLEFHHICFFVGCLLEDEKQDIQRYQENQTCWQNVMVFPSSVKQDKLNGQEIFKWLFGTDCVGETLD